MTAPKTGPLTYADLQAIWEGSVDESYSQPFIDAGDGKGLEAWGQAFEQLARVSTAIDSTTQQMFILPHSSQTGPPAGGARNATVTLTFARTKRLERPLVLTAGQIFTGEVVRDWGDPEGIDVETGRRYTLLEDLVFHPGEGGPFDVPCEAEAPGEGYNNPAAGTITAIDQPGVLFNNDLATVTVDDPTAIPAGVGAIAYLVTAPRPDMPVPEQVGQYVLLASGANLMASARVVSFSPPPVDLSTGSSVQLALEQSFEATVTAGTFQAGEEAVLSTSGATYRVLGERVAGGKKRLTGVLLRGNVAAVAAGQTLTGGTSGATLTVSALSFPQMLVDDAPVAGVGGASWRMMSWDGDWGLTATNAARPVDGRAPWLDLKGDERNIQRAPGEDDDVYRKRVATVADVVSPNAVKRALSRTLGSFPWCFREVGTPELPGFYFDADGSPVGLETNTTLAVADRCDAYDTDVIIIGGALSSGTFRGEPLLPGDSERVQLETTTNDAICVGWFGKILTGPDRLVFVRVSGKVPSSATGLQVRGLQSGAIWTASSLTVPAKSIERRFRTWLSYADMRGFFLVGVPRTGAGDFGFAFDDGPADAWDLGFFDGFPAVAARMNKGVWQAVEAVRMGGVGWNLYAEEIGCP